MLLLEHWMPISGYEGLYKISNMGNVRSFPRVTSDGRHINGRMLKPRTNGKGYVRVHLSKDGVVIDHYIHLLVLAHFVGPCPAGHEGNHKRGNKADNRVSQLEYLTRAQNHIHAMENGLLIHGIEHHEAKLNPDKVREIRSLQGSLTAYRAGKRYGVVGATIRQIWEGRTWKHVA